MHKAIPGKTDSFAKRLKDDFEDMPKSFNYFTLICSPIKRVTFSLLS
jgi:hypothetical protein